MTHVPETPAGRLNGWKEIARHLGKGPRTVQRWEKHYGLPVHRIGREGGEIVFAFPDEIDRWLSAAERRAADGEATLPNGDDSLEPAEAEAAPLDMPEVAAPAPPGARPGRRSTTAALVVAAIAVTLGSLPALRSSLGGERPGRPPGASRQPAAWRLANESLTVLDVTGELVFEHRFGFPLAGSHTSESWIPDAGSPPVLIADIDGDGESELLVRPAAVDRARRRLYCFEADGRQRFVHQPTGSRRFGNDEYSEPWLAFRTFVTGSEGGPRRLWVVFTHNLLFPSVLQELDPKTGTPRQEYWSDGFIELVAEGSWSGRPVVLVGGTNNDFRAASLAVFPEGRVSGFTPAVRPAYACRNCPPGRPETLFLFPSPCLARRRGQASVAEAWIEHGDRIRVRLTQDATSSTYYTIGPEGDVRGAEISREFQVEHAGLEARHEIDHPFGPRDDAEMFPVRRWDARGLVELPGTPVVH